VSLPQQTEVVRPESFDLLGGEMKSKKSMFALALTLFVAAPVVANTTWYVDGVNGSDGNNCKSSQHACKTIGHAISLAHSGDSIMVAPATYTENLTISISLKIIGSRAATTIVDGGMVNSVVTISSATANVGLSNLTMRNGSADGGGISNSGRLTINYSVVRGNVGRGGCVVGYGCNPGLGGGIYSTGALTINNSAVSGNTAQGGCHLSSGCGGGFGGGIYSQGELTVNGSTISGNTALSPCPFGQCFPGGGGGIYNSSSGTLSINNSTISGNTSPGGWAGRSAPSGGGIDNHGALTISNSTISGDSAFFGGGIYGSATLQNSIVANSSQGANCSGTMTSKGYNLSSDNTCNFNSKGDMNNTDPVLGTLGNYGGQTQTIPLLSGSPAIDAGNPNGCRDGNGHLLKTDQRGKPRPDKEDTGGCDTGAFERQSD
jgi:hypothetical protein